MEAINFNTKEIIIEAYSMRPILYYDIEGTLVEKDGKDIQVDAMVGDRRVSYKLRLKEDIQFQVGDRIKIDRENILSLKVEEKKAEKGPVVEEGIIKDLGLQDDEEVRNNIEYLMDNRVPITRENLESFSISKKYLKEIIHNIDFDSCVKLLDMDIDLEEDSLQKVAKALAYVNGRDGSLSIGEILRLDRELSYGEAKRIARDIYGRTMGKDIYDSIIALHREGLPITKENIDRVMEIMDKLYSLRGGEDGILLDSIREELPINIETLYKLKHSYSSNSLNKNITSPLYERFIIEREPSIEELLGILKDIGLAQNEQNLGLIREFMVHGVEVTRENLDIILDMKAALSELMDMLDEKSIARLIDEGIDPLKEDIGVLVNRIKEQVDSNQGRVSNETMKILEEINRLRSITDRELLSLIESGKDFRIADLKEIVNTNISLVGPVNQKIIEKTISISNIFNTLGNLDSSTIAFATRKYSTLTLRNLYDTKVQLTVDENNMVQLIDERKQDLIRQEYLNAKANIRLSWIRESVEEGIELEELPLKELNRYMDRRDRYREVQDLVKGIKGLNGKEDFLIPRVIKSGVHMSIGRLINMNYMLNYGYGLGNILDKMLSGENSLNLGDMAGRVQNLKGDIKKLSTSLREGKKDIAENYRNMLESLKRFNDSLNLDMGNRDEDINDIEKYIELQDRLSQDELILQIPVFTDKGYRNVNLIIPNIHKGMDKEDMIFHFNLETENLGQVRLNLKVVEEQISIYFESGKDDVIIKHSDLLARGLDEIGYNLKDMEMGDII
ncbi:MAG TPA: flagellar hook-length control protein FliK [Tepidimicrobium sp.]|nr:flagellar hook-length control protein FliK [Tepidimicrobium sp.]